MDFKTLQKKKYILLDGAMGTMLQKRGLKIGGIPEELNITNPDIVEDVHRLYIQAGSDIVYGLQRRPVREVTVWLHWISERSDSC